MDIRDFQGLQKYKVIVPCIYVVSWIFMIIGPIFYKSAYQLFCFYSIMYTNFKFFYQTLIMMYAFQKAWSAINKFQSSQKFKDSQNKAYFPSQQEIENTQTLPDQNEDSSMLTGYKNTSKQLFYAFIIPNYNEDLEMLAETLSVLASHTRAKQKYLIFLAMENHQKGSELKAEQLKKRFKDKFRLVEHTKHQVRQHEQKGKASNVSWCAEHLEPFFEDAKINEQSVFLTIIDADSWAPNIYFDLVEEHILANYEKRYTFIYQPPQIFARNNMDVPIFTRVHDNMHGFIHCSNLCSTMNITFPLSNYSLSYSLIKKAGFWDTCPEAIGEDFHTTQKCFWKTNGEITTVPIYTPFNQVNICTGNGYFEDVKARFWQAERHAKGCADVAYNFKMLFNSRFRPKNIFLWFIILETFTLPAIIPWILISLWIQALTGNYDETGLNAGSWSVQFLSFGSTIAFLLYQYIKRKSNKIFYDRDNESLIRALEMPVIWMFNFLAISTPTFVIAAFMTLKGNQEYVVAQKKNTTKK